jgi:hypothetical protein
MEFKLGQQFRRIRSQFFHKYEVTLFTAQIMTLNSRASVEASSNIPATSGQAWVKEEHLNESQQ